MERVNKLADQGYSVLVIWERDFLRKKEYILDALKRWVDEQEEGVDVL